MPAIWFYRTLSLSLFPQKNILSVLLQSLREEGRSVAHGCLYWCCCTEVAFSRTRQIAVLRWLFGEKRKRSGDPIDGDKKYGSCTSSSETEGGSPVELRWCVVGRWAHVVEQPGHYPVEQYYNNRIPFAGWVAKKISTRQKCGHIVGWRPVLTDQMASWGHGEH